jgi:hypothetical protein
MAWVIGGDLQGFVTAICLKDIVIGGFQNRHDDTQHYGRVVNYQNCFELFQ